MAHSYVQNFHHIVFSTKNRKRCLSLEIERTLLDSIGTFCFANNSQLVKGGGDYDHIHLLINISRQISISDFVGKLKMTTSKWMKENFSTRRFEGWQRGFFSCSVSPFHMGKLLNYIEGQREHHKKVSFREEYIKLLQESGIPFDEKYLW